ncbi:hypothetical protein [Methylovulum psychrotolerans]|uniref:DUF3341 domain-containing protein n=1 Tax=Methylovulum psychrotolerans TaxID=1704499 RepID=A0A1Z4C0P1_9GAMM|nr:hypothetical protein [Methylovulum psychrotolerans]ASF47108.1 hypothetical protein CEK71_14075 [Methylovulum psychrotolerans]
MTKAVFCIAQSMEQAELIVNHLKMADFSNNDISVLFPDKSTTQDFAHEKHTKSPEGGAIGGALGLGAGAIFGWLAGIGSLAIPGLGPFIAAGPIMGALSGAAVGAATGGLTGALIGLGIPEYEAKRYEGKISSGNALISVRATTSEERDVAKKIFEHAHAEDISVTTEAAVSA